MPGTVEVEPTGQLLGTSCERLLKTLAPSLTAKRRVAPVFVPVLLFRSILGLPACNSASYWSLNLMGIVAYPQPTRCDI